MPMAAMRAVPQRDTRSMHTACVRHGTQLHVSAHHVRCVVLSGAAVTLQRWTEQNKRRCTTAISSCGRLASLGNRRHVRVKTRNFI